MTRKEPAAGAIQWWILCPPSGSMAYNLFSTVPLNASNYVSSDPAVATVNGQGVVTPVAPGMTQITMTTPDLVTRIILVTVVQSDRHEVQND